jgi:hypothetical protein
MSISDLKKHGVDKFDIEVLKEHWKELNNNP